MNYYERIQKAINYLEYNCFKYLIGTPAINGDVEVVQHMPIAYKKE